MDRLWRRRCFSNGRSLRILSLLKPIIVSEQDWVQRTWFSYFTPFVLPWSAIRDCPVLHHEQQWYACGFDLDRASPTGASEGVERRRTGWVRKVCRSDFNANLTLIQIRLHKNRDLRKGVISKFAASGTYLGQEIADGERSFTPT